MSNYLSQIVNYDMSHNITGATHQYLDISIVNNDAGANAPVPLIFTESRTSSIIDDCSLYYLSIIRFHIDTLSLPIWLPQIQLNNGANDPNLTIYSFTMKYLTYEYQQYLEYIPQDKSISPPASVASQKLDDGYYFCYSYAFVINTMINGCLLACWNGLKALVEAGNSTMPSPNNFAPTMQYDPTSGEIILMADQAQFDSAGLTNPVKLYMNTPMYNMFSSFEFTKYGYGSSIINGKNFMVNIYNSNGTNVLQLDSYNAIQCFQEYSSTTTWSPVQSIVFASPSLPLAPTMIAQPKVFGKQTSMSNSAPMTTQNIITDMEVDVSSNAKSWLPSVNYTPFTYRLVDLFSHNSISDITIECYWKDSYNNLYIMTLPSGCNANLKILFRKKSAGV